MLLLVQCDNFFFIRLGFFVIHKHLKIISHRTKLLMMAGRILSVRVNIRVDQLRAIFDNIGMF